MQRIQGDTEDKDDTDDAGGKDDKGRNGME